MLAPTVSGLDVAAVCKTHGGKPIDGKDFKNGRMWGFALARRVAKGNKWHPATDELRGTDSYGSAPTNPTSGPTGTMKWNYNAVQYFLFSTGDFSEWWVVGALHLCGRVWHCLFVCLFVCLFACLFVFCFVVCLFLFLLFPACS